MIAQRPQLSLTFGPDRSMVWEAGDSVRYLVADIAATGTILNDTERVPLNLALAIDVSGSMSGEKLEAARATALAVVDALTPKDRLSLVAFESGVELLMDARYMDAAGRRAAKNAIARLETKGSTALFAGWDLAAGRVAAAMDSDAKASHRVMLLTDGQANIGINDAPSLAQFTADAQQSGIITSAVGIGNDYDEALLAAMVEAGGGRLHDASDATEIHEVVLGELLEGRSALVERATLSITLPRDVKHAEVVGPWRSSTRRRHMEVLVGSLRADQVKRVVIRIFCVSGDVGQPIEISASLVAHLPDGSAELRVDPPAAVLTFVDASTNDAQQRDEDRSVAALAAWQGAAMRQALQLNRAGRFDEAQAYLRQEISLMKRYAHGLRDVSGLLRELDLLYVQVSEQMDERVMKEVYVARAKSGRGEIDHRRRKGVDVNSLLQRPPRPR